MKHLKNPKKSRKSFCPFCKGTPAKCETHMAVLYPYQTSGCGSSEEPLCVTVKPPQGPRTKWDAWDAPTQLFVAQAVARRDMWHATFQDTTEGQTRAALGAQRYDWDPTRMPHAGKYPEWEAFDAALAA